MNRPLTFRSFCSGIGAPEVAWKRLGWHGLTTCELEPQPSAVLAHHHPEARNLGDMTTCLERMDDEYADVFVAGTPCQSFSVAGLRAGMADPRGNLALVFLGLVDRRRPEWVVWENVPGVLSSGGGRDFGAFLGALAELGYGWAYRILDAQYIRVDTHARAVPQRRRRVFVVGHLGDWRRAAAVLLERESLCGHPPPSREAGEGTAAKALRGATGGIDREDGHTLIAPGVGNCLTRRMHKGANTTLDEGQTLVAHTLRAEGSDASEDGTGRGVPMVFDPVNVTSKANRTRVEPGLPSPTMHERPMMIAHAVPIQCANMIERGCNGLGIGRDSDPMYTLENKGQHAIAFDTYNQLTDVVGQTLQRGTGTDQIGAVFQQRGVRRLTPLECERLQGFPDFYTQVPWKGKPMEDGPRYKMIGNSMAVNVMSWIGQRIQMVGGAT